MQCLDSSRSRYSRSGRAASSPRPHFSIISAATSLAGARTRFGFLDRSNDTMGTPLEAEPMAVGEQFLALRGWSAGKHARLS